MRINYNIDVYMLIYVDINFNKQQAYNYNFCMHNAVW